mgnify:CR=1 FL=1
MVSGASIRAQNGNSVESICARFLDLADSVVSQPNFDAQQLEEYATAEIVAHKALIRKECLIMNWKPLPSAQKVSHVEKRNDSATCFIESPSRPKYTLELYSYQGAYKVIGYNGKPVSASQNEKYGNWLDQREADIEQLDKLVPEIREGLFDLLTGESTHRLDTMLSPPYLEFFTLRRSLDSIRRISRNSPVNSRAYYEQSKIHGIDHREFPNDSTAIYSIDWNGAGINRLQFEKVGQKWFAVGQNDLSPTDLEAKKQELKNQAALEAKNLKIKEAILDQLLVTGDQIGAFIRNGNQKLVKGLCTPNVLQVLDCIRRKCGQNSFAALKVNGISKETSLASIRLRSDSTAYISMLAAKIGIGFQHENGVWLVNSFHSYPANETLGGATQAAEVLFDDFKEIFHFVNLEDQKAWEKAYALPEGAITSDQYEHRKAFIDNLTSIEGHPIFTLQDAGTESPQFPGGAEAMFELLDKHQIDKTVHQQVFVALTVERNGTISGFEPLATLSKQAMKSVDGMLDKFPVLTPAKMGNIPVRSIWRIPLLKD